MVSWLLPVLTAGGNRLKVSLGTVMGESGATAPLYELVGVMTGGQVVDGVRRGPVEKGWIGPAKGVSWGTTPGCRRGQPTQHPHRFASTELATGNTRCGAVYGRLSPVFCRHHC
jgi:hypothetical protein